MTKFQIVIAVVAVIVLLAGGFAWRSFAANASQLLQAGRRAPDFTLPNQEGRAVSLGSYRGQWVVLYFYPKDMTHGCTIEAHNFQRDIGQYHAANAVVVGVSLDSVKSHQKFCAKDGLGFTLLSDHEAKVSREYGVLGNYMGFKMDKRVTFLIDPEGAIAKVWTGVNPMSHSAEVLAELHSLKA